MNQQMIELYQEASEFAYKICREEGREGGPSDHIWNTLSTGRFAELIVRECSYLADQAHYKATGGKSAGGYIRQHFGVEE